MTDASLATALNQIDRAERQYKVAFAAAACLEALGLFAFIMLADFSDRTHVLLLVAAVLVYSTLGLGLVTLGIHVNRCTLRVLKALELSKG